MLRDLTSDAKVESDRSPVTYSGAREVKAAKRAKGRTKVVASKPLVVKASNPSWARGRTPEREPPEPGWLSEPLSPGTTEQCRKTAKEVGCSEKVIENWHRVGEQMRDHGQLQDVESRHGLVQPPRRVTYTRIGDTKGLTLTLPDGMVDFWGILEQQEPGP